MMEGSRMTDENKKYLDLEGGLARVRGNKKIYAKMLNMFLSSGEFDAFEQSIQDGDMAKAADVIHGIKGMTGNLSLTAVFELSAMLMQQLREGNYDAQLLDEYRDALSKTQAIVKETVSQLEE